MSESEFCGGLEIPNEGFSSISATFSSVCGNGCSINGLLNTVLSFPGEDVLVDCLNGLLETTPRLNDPSVPFLPRIIKPTNRLF